MPVKVGLVGLGIIGAVHWQGYQEVSEAEVVAVCDVRPDRLRGDWAGNVGNLGENTARKTSLGNAKGYDKFSALLKDPEVEMVDLSIPTFLHAKLALQALQAGKHVFCEKPMAIQSRLARKMIDAAEKAGKMLMVGHCLRFWPEYVMIKEMIDSGRYGKVHSATFRRLSGTPLWSWENWFMDSSRSGSAALDLHIHDVDTVQWMFGVPAKVSSSGSISSDGGVDHITTGYQYDNGVSIVAEGGWDFRGPFPFSMSASVVFESATVDFDSSRNPTLTIYHANGTKENPPVPSANAYAEELKYFVRCIASGTAPSVVTPAQAASAVAIVEAEIKSAKTGRPVAVKV